jgi:thiosulfate reductase cytochrome b subunit
MQANLLAFLLINLTKPKHYKHFIPIFKPLNRKIRRFVSANYGTKDKDFLCTGLKDISHSISKKS